MPSQSHLPYTHYMSLKNISTNHLKVLNTINLRPNYSTVLYFLHGSLLKSLTFGTYDEVGMAKMKNNPDFSALAQARITS